MDYCCERFRHEAEDEETIVIKELCAVLELMEYSE